MKHHYDDCHILIQCYFSVSESEFLFTPNFKSIPVKIAQLLKKITLYWSQNTVGYLFCFFSEIGLEFAVDANFHSASFLSQQHKMFQYQTEKDFDSNHAHRPKTHPEN